jgi:ABC-type Fe3+/spermidine/putrescine transport system ATPase subunit
MIGGAIRQIGEPRDVLDYPADRAVARLVQAGNILAGRIVACGGGHAVSTPVGDFRLTPGAWVEGAPVTAVVRPEGIRILREDRGTARFEDATILEGTLSEVADHGPMIAVIVQVGGGSIAVSLSPTAAANLELRSGRPVRLAVPPERVHVIPEESA